MESIFRYIVIIAIAFMIVKLESITLIPKE